MCKSMRVRERVSLHADVSALVKLGHTAPSTSRIDGMGPDEVSALTRGR